MTTTTEVLVVGAGPTGLTLACELRRRGVACRVLDRVDGVRRRSKGKGIQPRTLEVFDDLGIVDAALRAGRTDHRLRLYAGGRLVADLVAPARPPRPGVPYPNLLILPQWRTEQLLRERLAALGGEVEANQELTGFVQDGSGVTATVVDRTTGAEQRVQAAFLVGCDGGRSTVRSGSGIALRRIGKPGRFLIADVRIDGLPNDGSSFAWFDRNRYLAADPLDRADGWQVQASAPPNASAPSLEVLQRLFEGLLDTYQEERATVARDVLRGSDVGHSAVFSPHPVMRVLRERVLIPLLRLPAVRNAVLGRADELDVGYRGSSLVGQDGGAAGLADRVRYRHAPHPGDRAPDARGRDASGRPQRLFDLFRGTHFTLLLFAGNARDQATIDMIGHVSGAAGNDVRPYTVVTGHRPPASLAPENVFLDPDAEAHRLYGATAGSHYLLRPDGYVAYRARQAAADVLQDYLTTVLKPARVPAEC